MDHYRKKLKVAVRGGSNSLNTTNTSHVKNMSQMSAEGIKPSFESTGLSEQKSEQLIKPDSSFENKVTLLSPQASHQMHRTLRAKGTKNSNYNNLKYMLSPSGSELTDPILEEIPLLPDGQSLKEDKEYKEFKQKFERQVFEKGTKLLKVNPKVTIESPTVFKDTGNSTSKKSEHRPEESPPKRNTLRPQTALNSRNTSPRRLKQHFEQIRNRKLDILNSNLRALKNEKVIEAAKTEIYKMSMEASTEVYKQKLEK